MGGEDGAAHAPAKFMSDDAGGQRIGATDVAVANPTRAPSVSVP